MSKGHLIHLVSYFDDYYQFLELFPPFGRKKFLHNTLSRRLNRIMNGGKGAKEKGCVSLKGPKQKGEG